MAELNPAAQAIPTPPANPVNPMERDFAAAAEAAAQPNFDWILDLARGGAATGTGSTGGGQAATGTTGGATGGAGAGGATGTTGGATGAGGAPTGTQPAAAVAGATAPGAAFPPPAHGQSWGQWFEELPGLAARTVAGEYKTRVSGAFEQLKTDWMTEHPGVEAFKDLGFWEKAKKSFEGQLAAGKLPLDAIGLLVEGSGVGTAFGLGSKAAAKALNTISPTLWPYEKTAEDIERSLIAIAPAKGGLRTAFPRRGGPKAGGAAAAGEAAAGGEAAAAPFLKQALQAAKRDVTIGGEAMTVPEPHAVTILNEAPEVLTQLEDLLRGAGVKNLQPLGAGFSAVVFDAGDGRVVRLVPAAAEGKRLDLPEILQATHEGNAGNVHYEVLPKVDTTGITPKDVDDMRSALAQKGYSFNDPGADQLGKLPNGKLVIVDRDAVYQPKETTPFDPYAKDPAKQAEARARVNSEPQMNPGAKSGEAAAGEAAAGEAKPTVTMKTPKGPRPIIITPELKQQLKDYIEGKVAESPIEVAIEGLADPATRAETIAKVAKIIPKDEVKPVAVSKANAAAIGMTPDEIMARIRPNFPSDEAFAAAGAVLHSTTEIFVNASRRFFETGAAADREIAERALALLNEYIGDFRAGKTDLGRGMRMQQEVTEATPEHLAAVQKMVSEAASLDLEQIMKKAVELGDPKKVTGWLARLRSTNLRDTLVFFYQNALLSNPKSIFKEVLSDLVTASWDVGVRGIAEARGGVSPGAAKTLAYGYTSSFLDSLRLAARALVKGESQFAPEYQTIEGNVVKAKSRNAELAKGMAKPGEQETVGAAALRYLRMAVPTQWQMGADDFNKAWHYNAYRRMYAYEQAVKEGAATSEAVANRVRQLLENTPENIHEAAMAKALQNSFQEPLQGNLARAAEVVDEMNLGPSGQVPVGRFVMPFTKVPLNLGRWPVRNSPLAAMTRRYWDDVKAGGARKSLANASVGLGAGVIGAAIPLVYNDMLTGYGPHDPDTRRFWLQTHQPYSFRDAAGGWHSYMGLGPVAMLLGPVADTADVIRFSKTGQADDVENAVWSSIFGVGQAMLAPANLMGVGNFFDAIMNPEENAKYFGQNLVTSMVVPQVVWGIERGTDPWRRAHYDLLDNIRSHTPGLSKDLPPQLDIWGDKVRWPRGELWPITGSPFADAVSPIAYKAPGETAPISTWIWENRLAFPRGDEGRIISPPGKVQTYSRGGASTQVELTPWQHHRIKALAGNELKDPETKLGAKDMLNALVENKGRGALADLQREWNAGSPELKAVMVQRIWTKYRNAAKAQLLAEDEDLRNQVLDGLKLRGEALTKGAARPPLLQPQIQ